MKGLSYEGVVDITRETKETGQALKAHLTGGFETGADVSSVWYYIRLVTLIVSNQDHYLRRFIGVKQVTDGGPSPEQVECVLCPPAGN